MKNYLDNIKNTKVLVTGGLGFIGHNLVKSLINDYDCNVVVVDDCSNSVKTVLEGYNYQLIEERIQDFNLQDFLENFDYIFHLACVQIAHSAKDPLLDLETNAISTLKILEYLKNTPNKVQRFVYTSSASVYGNISNGICNENNATKVLSHYAASKLLGENYTTIYYKQYDVPTTSIRYSNVFGYGQTPNNPYCGVIGKFIDTLSNGDGTLGIFGDGQQTRDYTFITDAVEATILAAVHPNSLGQVFNVGTGVETSVNKLANELLSYNNNLSVSHLPPRDIDNIRRRFVDISFIYDKLGWEPKVTIENGLRETYNWYKSYIAK